MKLRRLATTVAATSALVLTGTVPAIADHAEPYDTVSGNKQSCEELGFDEDWKQTRNAPSPIDHAWFRGTLSDDRLSFSVEWKPGGADEAAKRGLELVVLVKGGNNTNVFVQPNLTDLFAPLNESGTHAQISNYTICKVKPEEETPEPTKTPEPSTTPEPAKTPEPEGKGGGEPSETPAPVPTEIPAGTGTADAGTAGNAGLVAMIAAFAAGAAVIIRRRFLTES